MRKQVAWRTALITGASSGIGQAFAAQLAARGTDLVVVARRRDRLETLAQDLEDAHRVSVEVLVADLADPAQRATVEARLASADGQPPVDLLVNNAGFGTSGRFAELDLDREEELVRVNVLAVVRLTGSALPGMVARRHGGIVNVSSLAGEQPLPLWADYAASKAYVTSFSRAVAAELKGSGVRVLAVLPGFTRTEFHEKGDFGQALIPGPAWMDAGEVTGDALEALDRGRPETIPGLQNRMVALASRMSPWPLTRQVLRTATRKRW